MPMAERAGRLSTEGMRYARAVTEAGSFSAAARSYGVTQPALSNGIATLEAHLGGALFHRSFRGVTPTDFGRALLPRIDEALHALDAVRSEAARWTTPRSETVRVGVSPLVDSTLVAGTYRALADAQSPDARRQLVLTEANMGELRAALDGGDLDVIVVPSVEPMPRFERRVIDVEPVVLVERGADDGPVPLRELADRQLILLPDTCGLTRFTTGLLSEHELALRTYPGEAGSYRVLEEWSHLGLGAAMLPVSKLSDPAAPHREVLDAEGNVVEIFYECVWDPASPIAGELAEFVDRLVRPAR